VVVNFPEQAPKYGPFATNQWEYAESFREQDGYAAVQGRKLHYWLYDTYTYHNGQDEVVFNEVVPH
jgi:hypothetical protein